MATLLSIPGTNPGSGASNAQFGSTTIVFDSAQTFTVPAGKQWVLESFGIHIGPTLPEQPVWSVKISLCRTVDGLPDLDNVLSEVVCTQDDHPEADSYWTANSGWTLSEGLYAIVLWGMTPVVVDPPGVYGISICSTGVNSYAGGSVFYRSTYESGNWTERVENFDDDIIVTGTEETAAPGQATNPNPADDATWQPVIPFTLSWSAGDPAATGYRFYFGDTSGDLTQYGDEQAGTTAVVPYTLSQGTEYFWRIDTVLDGLVTTGVEWSFTTFSFAPPTDVVTHRRLVAAANNKVWYEDL